MSLLKPQSFSDAHYYATRQISGYYNSIKIRKFFIDVRYFTPSIKSLKLATEIDIIDAINFALNHNYKSTISYSEAHSIPTYIVKIQERFMHVIFNRIIHNNKGVWYE